MEIEPRHNPGKPSASIYQIAVEGKITENWTDWFNGLVIDLENIPEEKPTTVLTCKVRDQAELNGILNWLHNLNLTLLKVEKT